MYDKNNYVVHIRTLKQALNHGLVLKKVHKTIQFNQKTWLKSHINMNLKLRTESKHDFKKDFFELTNNAVFRKNMGNARKHRDIKLVTQIKEKIIKCRNRIITQQNGFQGVG